MPRPEWLDSECAPFIRRILRARTDDERTAVAREFGAWLQERGDNHAVWFLHPKLRWNMNLSYEKTSGPVTWSVHPWDNNGHGCGCQIAWFYWACHYPTPEFLVRKDTEELVRAWLKNGVRLEEYPWTESVADRLGLGHLWRDAVKRRKESAEWWKRHREEQERRDLAEYERLKAKFEPKPVKTIS